MHLDSTPRRVVFFGDSRADWWDVPVVLGFHCIAAGVPGASAPYLAQRFQRMVAPLRPDIVVVQMGVNDLAGLHPRSPELDLVIAATRNAIATVVGAARTLGATVIVTTIFPLARGYQPDQAVQAAIRALTAALSALAGEGVQLFDSAAVLTGPDGYVCPAYADDELHLSHAGYAALNEALTPLLTTAP